MKLIARVMIFAVFAIALMPTKVPAVTMIGLGPGGTADTEVLRIETSPFASSVIGLAGFPSLSGLDFQPGTGTLFASSGFTDGGRLFTLDPTTGAATLVGITGFNAVSGLAFEPAYGTLFGSANTATSTSNFPDTLVTIDPATGAGTAVGPFRRNAIDGPLISGIDSLAVHPWTGQLFAAGGDDPAFD